MESAHSQCPFRMRWIDRALVALTVPFIITLFPIEFGGPSGFIRLGGGAVTFRVRISDPLPWDPWSIRLPRSTIGEWSQPWFYLQYVESWRSILGSFPFGVPATISAYLLTRRYVMRQSPTVRRPARLVLAGSFSFAFFLVLVLLILADGTSNHNVAGALIPLLGIYGGVFATRFKRDWPHRRRFPIGFCEYCGYNLTGNVSGRCPECGNRIISESMTGV